MDRVGSDYVSFVLRESLQRILGCVCVCVWCWFASSIGFSRGEKTRLNSLFILSSCFFVVVVLLLLSHFLQMSSRVSVEVQSRSLFSIPHVPVKGLLRGAPSAAIFLGPVQQNWPKFKSNESDIDHFLCPWRSFCLLDVHRN